MYESKQQFLVSCVSCTGLLLTVAWLLKKTSTSSQPQAQSRKHPVAILGGATRVSSLEGVAVATPQAKVTLTVKRINPPFLQTILSSTSIYPPTVFYKLLCRLPYKLTTLYQLTVTKPIMYKV